LVAILGNQRGRHWQFLNAIAYSLDGKRIATLAGGFAMNGAAVSIWEAASLRFQGLLPIQATFIQFVPGRDALLTCSADTTVRLWDLSGDKCKERIILRRAFDAYGLRGLAVSPNGKRLVAITHSLGEKRYTMDVYDLNASPPRRSTLPFSEGTSFIQSVYSPDSRTLATLTCRIKPSSEKWGYPSTTVDQKVTLWDVSGPEPKQRAVLSGPARPWGELAFSPDGKTIICGGNIWDLSDAKPKFRATMTDPEEEVWGCVFLPNGWRSITTSVKDHRLHVRVWDMNQRMPRIVQTVRLSAPRCGGLALAPDAQTIAVGEGNYLHIWHIKDGKIQVNSPSYGHMQEINALSFGACGNLLATSAKDGALRLWDLDGPRPRLRLVRKNEAKSWDTIALSPDGTKLAAAVQDGRFTLWTVSPAGLRLLAEHRGGAEALAFTPDSNTLFAAKGTTPIRVIDLSKPSAIFAELATGQGFNNGQGFTTSPAYPNAPGVSKPDIIPVRLATGLGIKPLNVHALTVSPDGQALALGGDSGIEVWGRTKKSWSRRTGFWYYSSYIRSMAFYRRGQSLLIGAGCGGGELRRFGVHSENPVQFGESIKHDTPVTSVAASSNGKFLASANEGGHVIVSSTSGEKLHEWTFPGPVRCVAFAPDGQHLALGNGDGTVYILRLTMPPKK
jgi:WD40 repeat protein